MIILKNIQKDCKMSIEKSIDGECPQLIKLHFLTKRNVCQSERKVLFYLTDKHLRLGEKKERIGFGIIIHVNHITSR